MSFQPLGTKMLFNDFKITPSSKYSDMETGPFFNSIQVMMCFLIIHLKNEYFALFNYCENASLHYIKQNFKMSKWGTFES